MYLDAAEVSENQRGKSRVRANLGFMEYEPCDADKICSARILGQEVRQRNEVGSKSQNNSNGIPSLVSEERTQARRGLRMYCSSSCPASQEIYKKHLALLLWPPEEASSKAGHNAN